MANPTFVLISSTTLGSATNSVTFSSIPQTYTDLVIRASAQDSSGNNRLYVSGYFNGDSSGIYGWVNNYAQFNGFAAGATSNSTYMYFGWIPGVGSTANTFGLLEVYIPNYTASIEKIASVTAVADNGNSSNFYDSMVFFSSNTYHSTAAISSITLSDQGGYTFSAGSSFNLYGINNS